ncbi:SemiSWEET family sugar transporter [Maribacter chungangensis]|uniref:SemiSWEET family sugar transporter n=1 Tax=Maribacter chungangensis TaxID=1069117 RepID=A0ABW3B7E7_9FLAO
MQTTELIGLVAATLTTAAFLPQVYKTWVHKSTRDISLVMYMVLLTGTLLWLFYGVRIASFPIILANSITAVLLFLMLLMKMKYR